MNAANTNIFFRYLFVEDGQFCLPSLNYSFEIETSFLLHSVSEMETCKNGYVICINAYTGQNNFFPFNLPYQGTLPILHHSHHQRVCLATHIGIVFVQNAFSFWQYVQYLSKAISMLISFLYLKDSSVTSHITKSLNGFSWGQWNKDRLYRCHRISISLLYKKILLLIYRICSFLCLLLFVIEYGYER